MYCFVFTFILVGLTRDIANARTACQFAVNRSTPHTPLLLRYGTGELLYPKTKNIIEVRKGARIKVTCGDQKFKKFDTRVIVVRCVKNDIVRTRKQQLRLVEFECEKFPSSIVRESSNQEDYCEDDTKLFEVGFQLSRNKFLKTMSICFDTDKASVSYSWYEFPHPNMHLGHQSGVSRPYFAHDNMYDFNVQIAYTIKNQMDTLAKILKSKDLAKKYVRWDGKHFLSRGHLTPKADYLFGAEQSSTFHYANVAPQWQIINDGNWLNVESDLRNLLVENGDRYQIFTGTYGVATLPDINNTQQELYLHIAEDSKKLPVPKFYWKVVFDQLTGLGDAIVNVNNPYLKEISSDYFLCNKACASVQWLVSVKLSNIERGYTYCCDMNEFFIAIGYKGSMFENNMPWASV